MSDATKKVEMSNAESNTDFVARGRENLVGIRQNGVCTPRLVGEFDNSLTRIEATDKENAALKSMFGPEELPLINRLSASTKCIEEQVKRIAELEVYEDVYKGRTDVPALRKRIKELESGTTGYTATPTLCRNCKKDTTAECTYYIGGGKRPCPNPCPQFEAKESLQ